ncbi:hypothetical protein P5D95_27075 [Vibrio parahaemolyticus]|nr:hypothetical protein [Vibrio parahaemolyticus]
MNDLIICNYEQTKEEILVDYDKDSFYENWQQNETWEISFSVKRSEKNSETFDLITFESLVIFGGQKFVIKGMSEDASGPLDVKSVTATHIYYTVQD